MYIPWRAYIQSKRCLLQAFTTRHMAWSNFSLQSVERVLWEIILTCVLLPWVFPQWQQCGCSLWRVILGLGAKLKRSLKMTIQDGNLPLHISHFILSKTEDCTVSFRWACYMTLVTFKDPRRFWRVDGNGGGSHLLIYFLLYILLY